MSTSKQKLAQQRNWAKFLLSGFALRSINLSCLTKEEQQTWISIVMLRNRMLNHFNENSKHLGLKVTPKCLCGKHGRYTPTYANEDWYNNGKNSGLVCKNHINIPW